MPAMEFFYQLLDVHSKHFLDEEKSILEANLFLFLYKKLNENFKKNNFFQMKNKETIMLDDNFISRIIHDILSTGVYTLSGIAYYTQTPEDILFEIVSGINKNPSFELSRRIIELHKSVRKELYQQILSKVTTQD